MPISKFHKEIFRTISANRSPESYVAGGTLINRAGFRYSDDIDLFHNNEDAVLISFDQDRDVLVANGYSVEPRLKPRPGFVRALVASPDGEALLMDWAHESSFRFFPVQKDEEMGWRLHWFDAATNKLLAASSRSEPRDIVDAMQCHRNPVSLGGLIWAAVGKDPGYSPVMMLEEIVRNARINDRDLGVLNVSTPIDVAGLRERFRSACDDARALFDNLPAETLGSAFLDENGGPIEPDPDNPECLTRPHRGSSGGAWPVIVDQKPGIL